MPLKSYLVTLLAPGMGLTHYTHISPWYAQALDTNVAIPCWLPKHSRSLCLTCPVSSGHELLEKKGVVVVA